MMRISYQNGVPVVTLRQEDGYTSRLWANGEPLSLKFSRGARPCWGSCVHRRIEWS